MKFSIYILFGACGKSSYRRLSLIETIVANKFPDLTTEMIMQLLDLKQTDITQSRFYQEIKLEGHQEGRQEEAAGLVLRLLKRRLGQLSAEQEERVRGLSVSQLEDLGEALLDFTAMADVENPLAILE
jgi:predicted transposase YdaD